MLQTASFQEGIEGFFGTINHSYLLHSYVDLDVAPTVQEPLPSWPK